MNIEASQFFKQNHYLKISQFITPEEASFLYDYTKLAAVRLVTLEKNQTELSDRDIGQFGTFNDGQVNGVYSQYGDLVFDTLLVRKLSIVENLIGLQLIANYSFNRLYTTGAELVRHKDRPSCEISTTLCLGYDVSNIDLEKYPDWDWPMYVGPNNGQTGTTGTPIHMKPGDMIIYRGCEIEHWREPFEGLNHAQVFLHYNEKDGQYGIANDGRPALGLPGNYKTFTSNELEV